MIRTATELTRSAVQSLLRTHFGRTVSALIPHELKYRLKKFWRVRGSKPVDLGLHNFNKEQIPLDASDPLSVQFHKLGPWFSRFTIRGRVYGGTNSYEGDSRVSQFLEWVRPAGRVLDLGSFEGAQSLMIAQDPGVTFVLGLDARDYLVRKAAFVAQAHGISHVHFKKCDFEIDRLATFGRFDAIFCSGVLYHLTRPLEVC